jgi:ribosomal protein RSM22 (predicted rRNA methylase)
MIELPAVLQIQLRQLLHQQTHTSWSSAAQRLSERYRAPRDGTPLVQSALDALAYSAMLLPATYAQISGALRMTLPLLPHTTWRSLLDIGSGPGTALWAANQYIPGLQQLTAIERDPHFIELARQVCAPFAHTVHFQQADICRSPAWETHDVVIIGHVLNELTAAQRATVIAAAWQATRHLLIIVEPGTAEFFAEVIRPARTALLAAGAHVVAPCPHQHACPMTTPQWCHFGQKIARPDFQRHARGVRIGWEEAKFSFVAATRTAHPIPPARLIHDPLTHKGGVTLPLCTTTGLAQVSIAKRDTQRFRQTRRLGWGDSWHDQTPE